MSVHNTLIELHNITINEISDEHEAHIKAKNEEIKRLCIPPTQKLINTYEAMHQSWRFEKNKTLYWRKKARSIVAMLFWEWRKAKIILKLNKGEGTERDLKIITYDRENNFKKAYAMLKDK